jgi:hypothetical protein
MRLYRRETGYRLVERASFVSFHPGEWERLIE